MTRALFPGDRPDFIEGFYGLNGPTANIDKRFNVVQKLIQLVDLAEQARDRLGESYRNFTVGCAVLAYRSQQNYMGIYFGGNYTPFKGADWNCAEKRAIGYTKLNGFDNVLALAVVGIPQDDTKTLHPCSKCRDMLTTEPTVSLDTLIVTATPNLETFEIHTVGSLILRHMTQELQIFPEYHPSLPGYWSQILAMNENAEVDRIEAKKLYKLASN